MNKLVALMLLTLVILFIVMMITAYAERPDMLMGSQCRVLHQMRVDTGGRCSDTKRTQGRKSSSEVEASVDVDFESRPSADSPSSRPSAGGNPSGPSVGGSTPGSGEPGAPSQPGGGSPGGERPGQPGGGSGRPGDRPPIDIQKLKGRLAEIDRKDLKEFLIRRAILDALSNPDFGGKPGGFDPPKGGHNAR